jgi:glucose/arabinose dehydrogenase
MLVAKQRARLLTFDKNIEAKRTTVILDISDRMKPDDWMGGILGLRLDPQFSARPDVYLFYSGKATVRLSRFRMDLATGLIDPATETILLDLPVPNDFHHGGGLAFGPDGFLYVAIGDMGPQHDPDGMAQNLHSLRGKILRIDVHSRQTPYGIPKNNPFIGKDALPEIWAYGFRNVWRMSFDKKGRLWAGDVGQNDREELDIVKPGRNYGWNLREGDLEHHVPDRKPVPSLQPRIEPPIFPYPRAIGDSVTAGFVYEGRRWPGLRGQYIFADWGSGKIMSIAGSGKATTAHTELTRIPQVNSIGRGSDGEPYFVSMNGRIYAFGVEPLTTTPDTTIDWPQSPHLTLVRSNPESTKQGERLFQTGCQLCHGTRGEGAMGPNLRDRHWKKGGTLADIAKSIATGSEYTGMPAWSLVYTPEKFASLAKYVSRLQCEPALPSGKAPEGEPAAPAVDCARER